MGAYKLNDACTNPPPATGGELRASALFGVFSREKEASQPQFGQLGQQ